MHIYIQINKVSLEHSGNLAGLYNNKTNIPSEDEHLLFHLNNHYALVTGEKQTN